MKELVKVVDQYKDLVLEAERYIWQNPETGYKEYKTNEYLAKNFEKLGYSLTYADGITGFYTTIDTGRVGPTVLVLCELDSLINKSHPDGDKQTGAVHCCGHNAECATMLGIAGALKDSKVLDKLSGKIKLCAVPAEEGIEISYRKELIKNGVIEFTSGKPEFIRRGYFSDVDIAFMVHAHSNGAGEENCKFLLGTGSNGVIRKTTTFIGVSAHAGSNPHDGVNALNVASTAISTVNSLRETFREKDRVRFHSIITEGGDSVNAVPDKVKLESYVRASSVKALKDANDKINRAISATAAAFGAKVEIEDLSGSEAMIDDENFNALAREVLCELVGADKFKQREFLASSTDMGDMSALFPSIHAYASGCTGILHGKDFFVADAENTCVENAKFQLALIVKLLENGAKKAKEIIENFTPVFSSVEEYLEHKRSVNLKKQTVNYREDGSVLIDYKG